MAPAFSFDTRLVCVRIFQRCLCTTCREDESKITSVVSALERIEVFPTRHFRLVHGNFLLIEITDGIPDSQTNVLLCHHHPFSVDSYPFGSYPVHLSPYLLSETFWSLSVVDTDPEGHRTPQGTEPDISK